jgi:hypothetical protein
MMGVSSSGVFLEVRILLKFDDDAAKCLVQRRQVEAWRFRRTASQCGRRPPGILCSAIASPIPQQCLSLSARRSVAHSRFVGSSYLD